MLCGMSTSAVRIREMVADDYDAVIGLWTASGLPFRPLGRDRRDRVAAELASASAIFLIAEQNGEPVGVVFGTHDGRKGWINRLSVHPKVQGRGIAKKLIHAAERRLEERGIRIVTCLIEGGNGRSEALFERLGYVRHDEIVYYAKRLDPEV